MLIFEVFSYVSQKLNCPLKKVFDSTDFNFKFSYRFSNIRRFLQMHFTSLVRVSDWFMRIFIPVPNMVRNFSLWPLHCVQPMPELLQEVLHDNRDYQSPTSSPIFVVLRSPSFCLSIKNKQLIHGQT